MKDEVRRVIRFKRDNFTGVERTRADALIADAFFAAYGGYDDYFVYCSFGSEADTRAITDKLLKLKKRVYLPRVEGENIVPVPYGITKKGAFGIEEPQVQAYAGKIDVTVTPLIAVNPSGCRIGYGRGFYDRFFKADGSLRVGIGYSFQQTGFTGDGWDEPLNAFISEKGVTFYG